MCSDPWPGYGDSAAWVSTPSSPATLDHRGQLGFTSLRLGQMSEPPRDSQNTLSKVKMIQMWNLEELVQQNVKQFRSLLRRSSKPPMGFDSRNHHGITSFFPLCILQRNNHCLTARMGCGAAHRLQPVSQAFGFESHGFPYRNRFKSQEPRAGKRESISKEFVVPDEQTAKTSWGTLLQRSPKYITSNLLKMMKHGFGR